METTLKEIISISGYSGLFKIVSQGRKGVIVESIADGNRMTAPITSKVTALTDISVFTNSTDLPLIEVLKLIRNLEDSKPTLNPKTSTDKAIREYFEKVLPDFDRGRVDTSDIKKILSWYNQLQANNLLAILDVEEAKPEEPAAEEHSNTAQDAES